MNKYIKYAVPPVAGAAYAAVTVLLSQWLLRGLGGLFGWIGGLAGLDADTVTYMSQVLGQLEDAALVSPWLITVLAGAVVGALLGWLIDGRGKRIVITAVAGVLLLLPLVLVVMWFTEVNGVRLGALLGSLLPLLPALL